MFLNEGTFLAANKPGGNDPRIKFKVMKTIMVNIDWENNFGAYSDEVSGCVATHKTLEGVK